MKNLTHIIFVTIIVVAGIYIGFRNFWMGSNFLLLMREVSYIVGVAFLAVGGFKFVQAVFYTSNRKSLYQGALCVFLGFFVMSFNVWAFIAAIVLIAWLEHRKEPLV